MAYENLLLDRDEAVLTITVNRPEVLNAQSRVMREELDEALAAAAEDAAVRVVILAGAGEHFWPATTSAALRRKPTRHGGRTRPGIPGATSAAGI